jgi:Rrf2 family transcriptional regulator, iron-sulfur cluster assembly transcription factor
MMLSTKGRYAVMAMVDLAREGSSAPVTLAAVAERQNIPLAYLEQIFSRLKRAGVVDSVRGPGGGYKIAGSACETSIADIVLAAEEHIIMTRCGGEHKTGCITPKTRCLTHDLWDGLGQHIHGYLSSITLSDVCESRIKPSHDYNAHFTMNA